MTLRASSQHLAEETACSSGGGTSTLIGPRPFQALSLEDLRLQILRNVFMFLQSLEQDLHLVYDNYDVRPVKGGFHLRSFFPNGTRANIIITSRNRAIATDTGASCMLIACATS